MEGIVSIPIEWVLTTIFGVVITLISFVWRLTHKKACDAKKKADDIEKTVAVHGEAIKILREDIKEVKDDTNYIRARIDKISNGIKK